MPKPPAFQFFDYGVRDGGILTLCKHNANLAHMDIQSTSAPETVKEAPYKKPIMLYPSSPSVREEIKAAAAESGYRSVSNFILTTALEAIRNKAAAKAA